MSTGKQKNKTYKVNKNFFEYYINAEIPNFKALPKMENNFKEKLDSRIQHYRDIYHLTKEKWSDKQIIDKYYTDIFAKTIFTKELIDELSELLFRNRIFVIIDPCCGNGFHMYLFRTFTPFCVVGIDIAPITSAWLDILAGITIDRPHEPAFNSLEALPDVYKMYKEKKGCTPKYMCMFLSDVEEDELSLELLKMFQGNLVFNIGNPRDKFIETYQYLDSNFNLIKEYKIKEVQGNVDILEIYKRKGTEQE